ncbi:MAG: 1-acyl-sn-glycerol-3-phosphate acyltransferase [Planctomycetes bacterium]|nr:1-acyl-sn-glycerol-3-phosphate acyltransferase [Planctomycetota bacterium]
MGLQVLWWGFAGAYLRWCHRLRIFGSEHLPSQLPFILVANHSSHLDALVLGSPLPWKLRDCIFPLAAGDTFFETMPASAFAAFLLNALPVWRKSRNLEDLQILRRRLIEGPCGYILFPEGTRSRTGEMGRFRRGIGMLAAGTAVPIVPCYIIGAFEAWPPHRHLPRLRPLTLFVGRPLTFEGVPNDAAGWTHVAAQVDAAVQMMVTSHRKGRLSDPSPIS